MYYEILAHLLEIISRNPTFIFLFIELFLHQERFNNNYYIQIPYINIIERNIYRYVYIANNKLIQSF